MTREVICYEMTIFAANVSWEYYIELLKCLAAYQRQGWCEALPKDDGNGINIVWFDYRVDGEYGFGW